MKKAEQVKRQIRKEEEEQLLREGIERLQKRFGQNEIENVLQKGLKIDVRSSARSSLHLDKASLNEDIISQNLSSDDENDYNFDAIIDQTPIVENYDD